MTIDFAKLAEPFPADEVEWRVGNKAKSGKSATLLCYLTSRAVQDRLDKVCGPGNWKDEYVPVDLSGTYTDKDGNVRHVLNLGFVCTLSIRIDGEWVSKSDSADCTDIEALKGGVSGSLKRAAVKWGIGRYLYGVDSRYHNILDGYGPDNGAIYCPLNGQPGHILIPKLPAWALPPEPKKTTKQVVESLGDTRKKQEPPKKEEPKAQAEQSKPPEVEGDPCVKCGHTTRKVGGGGYQDMRCAQCNHPCREAEDPQVPADPTLKSSDSNATDPKVDADKAQIETAAKAAAAEKWTDLERKRFHAKRSELGYTDYDSLAAWLESMGKPRPSAMPEETRELVLNWLAGSPQLGGNAAKVKERRENVRSKYDNYIIEKVERAAREVTT